MMTMLSGTQIEDVVRIANSTDLPNFSEPGTGKTLTTIGAIEAMDFQSGVIICPPVATTMWRNTLEYELGATVQLIKSANDVLDRDADFWVGSYAMGVAHQETLNSYLNGGVLVVDESQYVKSAEAQRAMALFGPRNDGEGGIYEGSGQCWLLSGTPVERYYDDLWSQLRATHPEVLQRYNALELREFQAKFCQMNERTYARGNITKVVSTGNNNARLLNKMVYKDIGAIRRTMEEVEPGMPEARHRLVNTTVGLSRELKDALSHLTDEEIDLRLQQGGDELVTIRRLIGMAKVGSVVEYVHSLGVPLLVGFWHTDVGKALWEGLAARGMFCSYIDGATPVGKRDEMRDAFIAGNTPMMIGQIQAMGVAMDGLQRACNHVVFAELDWSAAKMEQFYKRVRRRGQEKGVQVDYCVFDCPVDNALLRVAAAKTNGHLALHRKD